MIIEFIILYSLLIVTFVSGLIVIVKQRKQISNLEQTINDLREEVEDNELAVSLFDNIVKAIEDMDDDDMDLSDEDADLLP